KPREPGSTGALTLGGRATPPRRPAARPGARPTGPRAPHPHGRRGPGRGRAEHAPPARRHPPPATPPPPPHPAHPTPRPQETPTERSAAADVVRRMNALERSLALPALVARLTGARDARRDAVLARAKQLMDQELLAVADDITRHPETGYKEERSVKILTDYLQAHDFDVTSGVAGLKTAFVARYKKGTPGPNLGVILEYDALRGTTRDFHGDQHSA